MEAFNITSILEFLLIMMMVGFSVIVHECAHGFTANLMGDPTAKLMGRITLNPIAHIDPIGTILVPIIMKILGGPLIGWAKPVPVNFNNLRPFRTGVILVSIAGPLSNFILAFLGTLFFVLTYKYTAFHPESIISYVNTLSQSFIFINILLMVFNLMPIPPLDGSRVVSASLPYKWAYHYNKIESFGIIILIVLINTPFLTHYLSFTIDFVFSNLLRFFAIFI